MMKTIPSGLNQMGGIREEVDEAVRCAQIYGSVASIFSSTTIKTIVEAIELSVR